MAQISSIGSLPDPIPSISTSSVKAGSSSSSQKATQTDEAQASPIQATLSRLSSVLNGLQQNATVARSQYVQAYNKVKSGTYSVSSADVSRSMVDDMLKNQ